jgi:hypothetical protein
MAWQIFLEEKKNKLQFSLYNSIFLMLIERLQDPCSKLKSFYNQQEYVNLPPIALHHLYRALDKLDASNVLIQQQIFQTGRDLFNQEKGYEFIIGERLKTLPKAIQNLCWTYQTTAMNGYTKPAMMSR